MEKLRYNSHGTQNKAYSIIMLCGSFLLIILFCTLFYTFLIFLNIITESYDQRSAKVYPQKFEDKVAGFVASVVSS